MTGTRKRVACAAALAVTAALTGLFFMWESPAKPAGKRTAAATETATAEAAATEETNGGFRMLDGASVRLSKDGDFYGIRFGAKVEDATKRYAMLIVPATLAAGYEQGKESGETLSEYCERRAEEAGGRVAKAEELTADAEKEISCALVNVRWENLNRAFSGIAYYETEDGRRIEAARAEESERSVAEVAEKALEAGELTERERAAVERLKTDGAKQADGIAVDTGLTDELFRVVKELPEEEYSAMDMLPGFAGWKVSGKTRVRVQMNAEVWKSRLRFDTGTASFLLEAMNRNGTVSLRNAAGETVWKAVLDASARREFFIATELLETAAEAVFESEEAVPDNDTAVYYMGEIRERSEAAAAAEAQERIEKLRKLYDAGETGGEFVAALKSAKQEYETGLSAAAKARIPAAAETLSRLWNAVFETRTELFAPKSSLWQEFISGGPHPVRGKNVQVKVAADELYGRVWTVSRTYERDSNGEILPDDGAVYGFMTEMTFGAALSVTDKAALAAEYTCIKFYVYVAHSLTENETTDLYFTKIDERYFQTDAAQDRKKVTLTNGAWTEIALTKDEFIAYGRMTALFAILAEESDGRAGLLKFSPLFACS